jgi:hypothetical protein
VVNVTLLRDLFYELAGKLSSLICEYLPRESKS